MANPNLSTAQGCQELYKAVKRNLVRTDFPAGPEGWQQFCDHKIRKHEAEAKAAALDIEHWTKLRQGEHLVTAIKQLAEVEKLTRELAEAKAALAKAEAAKGQQAKG